MIEHDNIIYINTISEIGGVETYVYELVKKYQDNDIAVVCKQINYKQRERLKKICPVYEHRGEKVKCKVIIIGWDNSILDYLDEETKPLIVETIHADYCYSYYKSMPVIDKRVDKWFGITKHICKTFSEKFGVETELCYNPLIVEKKEKPLILISATRLSEIKGKNRMIKLAQELDIAGINYIWYVFTNDIDEIPSENVIYMRPRLDISYWMEQADYLVQLSDTEACSYAINEALYRNIPVIVTPLPYLEEIGVKDGVNSYIMEFNCSNVRDIVKKIRNVPSFNFTHLEDRYDEIIVKGKSKYKEELKMKFLVEATDKYTNEEVWDEELSKVKGEKYYPKKGEQWEVDKERKDKLERLGYAVLIKEIKEEAQEEKKEPKKEVKKTTKKATKKKE